MGLRYIDFTSREKAEGFIDGVEWANDGALHVKGLYSLPNGMYVVAVEDDDEEEIQQTPVGWDLCREIDYGGLNTNTGNDEEGA